MNGIPRKRKLVVQLLHASRVQFIYQLYDAAFNDFMRGSMRIAALIDSPKKGNTNNIQALIGQSIVYWTIL